MIGLNLSDDKLMRRFDTSKQTVLKQLCGLMYDNNFVNELFECYFAYCNIQNGLCGFDLLRFSNNCVLNIELVPQSDFTGENDWQHIENIMRKNMFYLSYISQGVICYCFCEGDGLYKFDREINGAVMVNFDTFYRDLHAQNEHLKPEVDVYSVLNHTKFLVSPLNNTRAFVSGEYYLTDEQQNICDDILRKIDGGQYFLYNISSLMGAGKSMVVYHIAKILKHNMQDALIIHGGSYTDGHLRLKMQYGFDICCIKDIALTLQCLKIKNKHYGAVLVDDAQRFTKSQIRLITDMFMPLHIPVILAFDTAEKSDEMYQNSAGNVNMTNQCIRGNMRYKSKIDFTF